MIATVRNRVAPRQTEAPVVPVTAAARQAAYAEAVLAAVLTLQTQLRHPDAKIARDAAIAIVDLEKTRLRHGEPVAGTHAPAAVLEPLGNLEPLGRPHASTARSTRGEEKRSVNLADPWSRFVDQVWDEMQAKSDADGGDEIISLAQAEERARVALAELREPAADGGCHPAAGIPHPTPPPHPVK